MLPNRYYKKNQLTTTNKKYLRFFGNICICHKVIDPSISGSNNQGILITNTLSCLIIHRMFVSNVNMHYRSNMKVQLHNLYLEHYLSDKDMIKIADVYVCINISNINNVCIINLKLILCTVSFVYRSYEGNDVQIYLKDLTFIIIILKYNSH